VATTVFWLTGEGTGELEPTYTVCRVVGLSTATAVPGGGCLNALYPKNNPHASPTIATMQISINIAPMILIMTITATTIGANCSCGAVVAIAAVMLHLTFDL
jgi:hypothetical protein